ncbi:hypothetical protein LR48_Vigan797s000100 [Vigna angularis]|uniref:Uncharacterized protein n=1 Tax=Phaseolus angularis TaxID=3914 RepID=A0A0L9TGX4_PHAAN|nr:hypothetical protein LR48_Vigan797s000100 [Vigna angularis]
MAHQEHPGIISDEVRDEIRLYECARKYETIVKQSRRGSASDGRASSNQSNRNEAIVQTVTRFLHELRTKSTDSDYSARA